MYKIRTWKPIYFGKYKGKTLPEILLTDPNYFFFCYDKGYFSKGKLANEARDIHKQACRMRVPRLDNEPRDAQYYVDPQTDKFVRLELVLRSEPQEASDLVVVRLSMIDLSFAYRKCPKDINGGGQLARDFRKHFLFLNPKRPTAEECNALFDNTMPLIPEPEPGYHWLYGRPT